MGVFARRRQIAAQKALKAAAPPIEEGAKPNETEKSQSGTEGKKPEEAKGKKVKKRA